MKETITKLL